MNNKEHYNNFINAVYANFDKYTKYSEYYREPNIKVETINTVDTWSMVKVLRKINIIDERLQPNLMFDANGITKDGNNKFITLLCKDNAFRDMERAIHIALTKDYAVMFSMYYVGTTEEKINVRVSKNEINFLSFTIESRAIPHLDGFKIMTVHKDEILEKLVPELEILARMNKAFLDFKEDDANIFLPYVVKEPSTLSQEAKDADSCILSGYTKHGSWGVTPDRLIIKTGDNTLEFSNDIRVIDELITAIGPMFIPVADLLKSMSFLAEPNLVDAISTRVLHADRNKYVREGAGDIALNVTEVTVDRTTIKGIYGNSRNLIDYSVLAILVLARKELNDKLEDMFKNEYLKNI